jgi:hypothetical protein
MEDKEIVINEINKEIETLKEEVTSIQNSSDKKVSDEEITKIQETISIVGSFEETKINRPQFTIGKVIEL